MATAQNIIDGAVKLLGIKASGQSATANESADMLTLFQDMIASWANEKSILPFVTSESFALVIGQADYTIGSSGNFDTVRPLIIKNIFVRDGSGNDYQVHELSLYRYNNIIDKATSERPDRYYYEPEYPLGKIRFNKKAAAAETVFIDSLKSLVAPALLADTVDYPPGYQRAVIYNLAVSAAPMFDTPVSGEIAAIAGQALTLISGNNVEAKE